MTCKYPLGALDSARSRLKCGVDLLLALHTAIEEGGFSADSYTDALFAVWDYLDGVSKEISSCVDDHFAQLREGHGPAAKTEARRG